MGGASLARPARTPIRAGMMAACKGWPFRKDSGLLGNIGHCVRLEKAGRTETAKLGIEY